MITGIEISKVEANRELSEAITNMKFNINFDNVKVNQENVNVAFTFTADYEGGSQTKTTKVGQIKIVGNIVSKEGKKDAEDIETTWKNKKTLPIKYAEDVINILNFECGARGTLVAYSIGFAAPLPISRAKLQETNQGETA
ncbi:MAG: hypothetical protein M1122_03120 [Candidatus Marsarchaeota archaeon]|jgi:hypothetical protein|nr:hypothetical protein [Candidatus Marsarchaeota archaeon]